ncbi:MAG: hypothetical protein K2X93_13030 [Candidatus Obscuribacterales bacterium]|nr:hypothetical protein [Candidatus Obscuribacterales bacterium]
MKTLLKRHPRFWRVDSDNQSDCDLSVDESVTYDGQRSCFLRNEGKESTSSAEMIQTMGAVEYRGKRIRFSAKIKAENLLGEASLFVRILDTIPSMILRDEMDGRRITGTHDWVELDVVIDVPSEARYINFGALLKGNGGIWIADLAISEVSKGVALTENGFTGCTAFPEPTNFELVVDENDKDPLGWKFHTSSGAGDQFKSGLQRIDNRSALWITSQSELTPQQGEKSNKSGTFTQSFNCSRWRGQRVIFSADIKCKNVGDWCGLMMWVKGVTGKTLAFTTMYHVGCCGDSDWQKWSVILDVSPIACSVVVAATLNGNGEAFFSNLSFSTAEPNDETTDRTTGPRNLSFAE